MPKLSPLHWIGLAVVFLFYGFTVFALTRDYYLRHPPAPAIAASAPAAQPSVGQSRIPETISESNPLLLHQQADALFVAGSFQEAAKVYSRILELDPSDAEAHNDLGLALHYSGDTQGAIAQLRTAVEKAPNLQRPWLTLGFLSMQAGEKPEAKTALERARDLSPDTEIGKEAVRLLGLLDKG